MAIRKSQINQAINGVQEEKLELFAKTLSPYIKYDNELMEGFLNRLERYYMNCYNSVQIVENLYNYTKEND